TPPNPETASAQKLMGARDLHLVPEQEHSRMCGREMKTPPPRDGHQPHYLPGSSCCCSEITFRKGNTHLSLSWLNNHCTNYHLRLCSPARPNPDTSST
ncbi:mCG1030778, partial [Mus musculus]